MSLFNNLRLDFKLPFIAMVFCIIGVGLIAAFGQREADAEFVAREKQRAERTVHAAEDRLRDYLVDKTRGVTALASSLLSSSSGEDDKQGAVRRLPPGIADLVRSRGYDAMAELTSRGRDPTGRACHSCRYRIVPDGRYYG